MTISNFLTHYFFPSQCFLCQESINSPGLCGGCWSQLAIQVVSFDFAHCQGFSLAFYHNSLVKKLILQLKHGDQPQLSHFWANLMAQAMPPPFESCNWIVPIPLHWFRLFKRQYNQSGLIARVLSQKKQIPHLAAIRRIRATPPQGHLSIGDRQANVRDAFAISNSRKSQIFNQSILLIDDVLTSGATLNEAARVLLENGACQVFFATAAYAQPD